MTTLVVADDIAEELTRIAEKENATVDDVLREVIATKLNKKSQLETLRQMRGIITDDLTDASTTVKETVREYFLKKYTDAQNSD